MIHQSALLNVMVQAVEKATHHWRHDLLELEQLQMTGRPVHEFAIKSYAKTATLLKQELTKARPKYGFISPKETIDAEDDAHCWMVEPLDGIHNFGRALPFVACAVGLLREGRPYAGVMYTPLQQQLFWAEQGSGAFSPSRRLRVAGRQDGSSLLIGTSFGQDNWQKQVQSSAIQWRDWGCHVLAMAYTASGALDGFMSKNDTKVLSLSSATGAIFIREAGGLATDFAGEDLEFPSQDVVFSAESTHKKLLTSLE